MKEISRAGIRAAGLALAGLGAITYASGALACGEVIAPRAASFQDDQGRGPSSLMHQASSANPHSIVGMWSFKMTSNGGTVDWGYVQWHSDGTEIENSGGRAPSTENFCMGVWTQTSTASYHLNHLALSYDSSGNLNAKVNIKEDVNLNSSGTMYNGSFTLSVYDPNSNALLQQVTGQVTGQRVPSN